MDHWSSGLASRRTGLWLLRLAAHLFGVVAALFSLSFSSDVVVATTPDLQLAIAVSRWSSPSHLEPERRSTADVISITLEDDQTISMFPSFFALPGPPVRTSPTSSCLAVWLAEVRRAPPRHSGLCSTRVCTRRQVRALVVIAKADWLPPLVAGSVNGLSADDWPGMPALC